MLSVRVACSVLVTVLASSSTGCGGTVIFDESEGEAAGSSETTSPSNGSSASDAETWRANAEKVCRICSACSSCTEAEIQGCIAAKSEKRLDAASLGCAASLDAYEACVAAHATCDELKDGFPACNPEADANSACLFD